MKALRARAWRTETGPAGSARPAVVTWASSTMRRADTRSPAIISAIDPMHSAYVSASRCPACRAAATAVCSAGRAAAVQGEELVQPSHAFGGRARDPVPAHGGGEIDPARVAADQAPLQHRT